MSENEYKEVNKIRKIEQDIIKFWEDNDIFLKSIANRPESEQYKFYDGPPFANGLPHYGHLLTGYIKDAFARFRTMYGKRVERKAGWDCHGLPAEMGAEKKLNITGRKSVEEFGIDNFNNTCKQDVMKYSSEWEEYIKRQARWVDFEHGYKTMDKDFMESVLWVFKSLHDQGLIYEDYRVLPYSWACETPLSNFETRLDDSYREKLSKSVIVSFTSEDWSNIKEFDLLGNNKLQIKYLVWTTTPWTLPSNMGLAVGSELDYVAILFKPEDKSKLQDPELNNGQYEYHVMSKNYAAGYLKKYYSKKFEKLSKNIKSGVDFDKELIHLKGAELVGYSYAPLFPYFKDLADDGAFKIHNAQFVSDSDGTGIVHMAPGFGEDDFILLSEKCPKLKVVCPVDEGGKFTNEVSLGQEIEIGESMNNNFQNLNLVGRQVFDTNDDIIKYLKSMYCWVSTDQYRHNYPHCWRTDTPLIYKAVPSWYLSVNRRIKPDVETEYNFYVYDYDNSILLVNKDCNISLQLKILDEGQDVIGDLLETKGVYSGTINISLEEESSSHLLRKISSKNVVIEYCQANYGANVANIVNSLTKTKCVVKGLALNIKERMILLNKDINWIPNRIRDGQFAKWLEGSRDWSISRNRFWGTPIPVWRSNNPENDDLYVFGSVKDLSEFFSVDVTDLHRPYIDNLTKDDFYDNEQKCYYNPYTEKWYSILTKQETEKPKNIISYKISRIDAIFDCWFESGAMPYAQHNYPFNKEFSASCYSDYMAKKDLIDSNFKQKYLPADFIVEYVAQTRGWFYTLLVLSSALFNTIPFKNCICHGVVLDNTGKKLSKRLNNYADPMEVFNKYGSDSLRFLMLSSPIVYGDNLLLDQDGDMVKDTLRLVINPILNALSFFTTYSEIDGINGSLICNDNFFIDSYSLNEELDALNRYILSKLVDFQDKFYSAMSTYNTYDACKEVRLFLDILNNWYIRRNRKIFWERLSDNNYEIKVKTYEVLYTALYNVSVICAPVMPLMAEYIWKLLARFSKDESCHLYESIHLFDCNNSTYVKHKLVLRNTTDTSIHNLIMDKLREICTTMLAIRNENYIRVRQPLAKLVIYVSGDELLHNSKLWNSFSAKNSIICNILKDEVNVKEIELIGNINQIAEYTIKLDFVKLGKRLKSEMKKIITMVKNGEWEERKDEKGNNSLFVDNIEICNHEYEKQLKLTDSHKDTKILQGNDAIITLDLNITHQLLIEGLARDLVRLIQNTRKNANFNITDKISFTIIIDDDQIFMESFKDWKQYICSQTLSDSVDSKLLLRGDILEHEHISTNPLYIADINHFVLNKEEYMKNNVYISYREDYVLHEKKCSIIINRSK